MADQIWTDDLYVKVYRLARSGMSDTKIAGCCGVTHRTFLEWKKKRPALRRALKEGRAPDDGVSTFQDYVLSRLPPKLQGLWKEVMRAEEEPNHIERVEALLANCGKRARQRLFVYALVQSNYKVSEACRKVQISRKMFDRWVTSEPDFAEMMDEVEKCKGDFFEGALVSSVERGEVPSIIFANKTYNANRGYGNKLQVQHSGGVSHSHSVVPIEDLDLPLEVKKEMLRAIRDRQKADLDHPRLAQAEDVKTVR